MFGHTILDIIRDVVIRDKVGVTPIENKMRVARLRWFGYIKRRFIDALVRSCERIVIPNYERGKRKTK